MILDVSAARRYGKQIALRDVGSEGQERLLAAEVALAGADLTIETSARYLGGAGVGRFRVIAADGDGSHVREAAEAVGARARALSWPANGEGWEQSLRGTALVVRSGFDDDAMLRAAVRLGIPVVVTRAAAGAVDVLSLRMHGPCAHQELDLPARAAVAPVDDGAAVLAGTLAAAEAALVLAHPGQPPRARHLRLPLDGDGPTVGEIPWSPECFLCGGSGSEMVPR
jgi:hypothetical protein